MSRDDAHRQQGITPYPWRRHLAKETGMTSTFTEWLHLVRHIEHPAIPTGMAAPVPQPKPARAKAQPVPPCFGVTEAVVNDHSFLHPSNKDDFAAPRGFFKNAPLGPFCAGGAAPNPRLSRLAHLMNIQSLHLARQPQDFLAVLGLFDQHDLAHPGSGSCRTRTGSCGRRNIYRFQAHPRGRRSAGEAALITSRSRVVPAKSQSALIR